MIPQITDPMGKYWSQPDRSDIIIDEKYAMMSLADFQKLHEYTCTLPTGTYVGKMWKAKVTTESEQFFLLAWYDRFVNPNQIAIECRRIIVV